MSPTERWEKISKDKVLLSLPCGIPDPGTPSQPDPAHPGAHKGRFKAELGQILSTAEQGQLCPLLSPSSCCPASLFARVFFTVLGNLLDAEESVTHTKGRAAPAPARTSLTPWGTEPGPVPVCREVLPAAHGRASAPTCSCWAGQGPPASPSLDRRLGHSPAPAFSPRNRLSWALHGAPCCPPHDTPAPQRCPHIPSLHGCPHTLTTPRPLKTLCALTAVLTPMSLHGCAHTLSPHDRARSSLRARHGSGVRPTLSMRISLRAIFRITGSSSDSRNFLMATICPVSLLRHLKTTPYEPSPTLPSFS